jgi:hypothetical protein
MKVEPQRAGLLDARPEFKSRILKTRPEGTFHLGTQTRWDPRSPSKHPHSAFKVEPALRTGSFDVRPEFRSRIALKPNRAS